VAAVSGAALPGVRLTAGRLVRDLLVLSGVLVAGFVFALQVGEHPVSLRRAFADPGSIDAAIVFQLRMPRAALAALVGAALASTGATLQALLRNPLADPFVLGVSGGAALGATLALAAGSAALAAAVAARAAAWPSPWSDLASGLGGVSPATAAAFVGAIGATAIVYAAGKVGGRLSPHSALLAGVIFNAVAAAAITCVKALAAPEKVGELLYWLAGAIGYERAGTLLALGLFEAVAIAILVAHASRLNLLAVGEESAASLGVEVARERKILFLATSMAVAGAVSLSGLIGFVGLLTPHVLRLWLGPDHRRLVPACALAGGAFLVAADGGARLLFPALGTEPPVGVLTALIGGPLFLVLLRREGKRFV
jgi:iron complex transport system permease protein